MCAIGVHWFQSDGTTIVLYIQSLGREFGHWERWWVVVFIELRILVMVVGEVCPEFRLMVNSEICECRIASLQR